MFYDKAKIYVKGGDGGSGEVAFRREKYVPAGGPCGGDGGRGGDVVFIGDPGLRTLVDFKYRQHYKAGRGKRGQGKNKHGKSSEDLVVRVPIGTLVKDAETGEIIADIVSEGQKVVVARGGRGGRGNASLAGPRNSLPSFAEKGEPGEEKTLLLELKLLADVGLIGMPNAGKSTLISRISAARPKIASYPFTTLSPNLGVVKSEDGRSFVVADIPGLIEGAHRGTGLGRDFLRHVERSRLLVHVLDAAATEGRDVIKDFYTVNKELKLYGKKLAEKPQIIAANKIDITGARDNLEKIRCELGDKYQICPVSAVTGEGIKELLNTVDMLLRDLEKNSVTEQYERETTRHVKVGPRFEIIKDGNVFLVKGRDIERKAAMANLENEEAAQSFQLFLEREGVEDALRRAGVRNGDKVIIGKIEFYFKD